MDHKSQRALFFAGLWTGLKVAWPILSGLLGTMAALGVAVAVVEDWTWPQGIYFAFISGLTIGYGDLVPKHAVARSLAIVIGLTGVLLVALVAAIAVRALNAVESKDAER